MLPQENLTFSSSEMGRNASTRTRIEDFLDPVGRLCCYRRHLFHAEVFSLWLQRRYNVSNCCGSNDQNY